jgi:hypothetical protein
MGLLVARLAIAVLAAIAVAILPLPAAAAEVSANGLIFATGVVITPISSNGVTAKVHLHATATETGTLDGTSVADNTCLEVIATQQATCSGPETLTGLIAGRNGVAVFFDSYSLNFGTGITKGTARITSSTVKVTGAVKFAGNAFSPSGLPYAGEFNLR